MRFSTYINNQKCLEWGLNANQGALFDLLNQASSWAHPVTVDGIVFYWVARDKVIEELPLFYSKADTVYRHFKDLSQKGLIEYLKIEDKDLIRLTEKGKTWNEFCSNVEQNRSDLNPTLGNKSEFTRKQIRKSSDLNPTDKYINNKNTTDQNKKTTQKSSAPVAKSSQATPKKPTHTFDAERVNLPPFVNRDVWIKFVQHRKAISKPIKTQYTVDLLVNSLEKHSLGDEATATAMLNQSCERGWTGIFALKADFPQKPTTTAASKPNAHSGFEHRHYGETVMPSWAEDGFAGGEDA